VRMSATAGQFPKLPPNLVRVLVDLSLIARYDLVELPAYLTDGRMENLRRLDLDGDLNFPKTPAVLDLPRLQMLLLRVWSHGDTGASLALDMKGLPNIGYLEVVDYELTLITREGMNPFSLTLHGKARIVVPKGCPRLPIIGLHISPDKEDIVYPSYEEMEKQHKPVNWQSYMNMLHALVGAPPTTDGSLCIPGLRFLYIVSALEFHNRRDHPCSVRRSPHRPRVRLTRMPFLETLLIRRVEIHFDCADLPTLRRVISSDNCEFLVEGPLSRPMSWASLTPSHHYGIVYVDVTNGPAVPTNLRDQ